MKRSELAHAGMLLGRACARALVTLIGANLLCFVLLFVLHPGSRAVADPAASTDLTGSNGAALRMSSVTPIPLLFNASASGRDQLTETLLFDRNVRVLSGDFGEDARGRRIADELAGRIGPSMALVGVPMLLFLLTSGLAGLVLVAAAVRRNQGSGGGEALALGAVTGTLVLAGHPLIELLFECLRSGGFGPGRLSDTGGALLGVGAVLAGLVVALWWRNLQLLPVLRGAVARAARARGLPELTVCLKHGAVSTLPALRTLVLGLIAFMFMLGLVLETLFEVPGLGQYAVEAFHAGDVVALHSVMLLGVLLHLVGLNLTWLAFARFEPPRPR